MLGEIPAASAGMTDLARAGMTEVGRGDGVGDGWGLGTVRGEIPAASAGMTEVRRAGATEVGRGYDGPSAGMTEVGRVTRCRGCGGGCRLGRLGGCLGRGARRGRFGCGGRWR